MTGWIGRTLSQLTGSLGVSHSASSEVVAKGLNHHATALFDPSNYSTTDIFEYALELAHEIALEFNVPKSNAMLGAITDCIELIVTSCAILPADITWELVDHEGDEGYRLRKYLERHKRFHEDFTVNDARFRQGLFSLFAAIFEDLPQLPIESEGHAKGFGVQLGDLLPNQKMALDSLVRVPFHPDLQDARLFEDLRDTLEGNISATSGINRRSASSSSQRFKMPRDFQGSNQDATDAYLAYTPFKRLLKTPIPFTVPAEARFEHTHIVGGTGHGKTQLMSHFILQDLVDIFAGKKKSMVVIDSQGDLIRKISSMLLFDPRAPNGMADKIVIIDPNDVEFPTALNIFAINQDRLAQYGAAERERVFNGAVELYEHFFAGLLGAEMTQKQSVTFTYLARLMLEMPNATILTLRDLMDDPTPFKGEIAKLSGSSRMFFEREFLSNSFTQTRRQISRRLWGVLAIPAFERMFSQTEHKVDLFDLLNSGKIILINTSQALLKKEGSAIFGKFFMAAISQAISERAVLPEDERTDTIIYLDEAHEYADESLEILLNQGRKYKAGVVIAHQFLDQLSAMTRQSLLSNASVKIVGGLSHKDNQSFAREMGTDTDFLATLLKHESSTEFGLWIKHVIPQALRLSVPFGLLESANRLDHAGEQAQLDFNRAHYGTQVQLPPPEPRMNAEPTQSTETPKPLPKEPQAGRGGTQHREIQEMIKGIGHDLGFGVSIEAKCQNSDGAIDVLLNGEKTTIAVEVSITTSPEHELENLRKCLKEPVDLVLCVSPDDTHRLAIQNLCLEQLPQTQAHKIKYLRPSALAAYLDQFDERETRLIRGYEVVVRTAPSDPEDVAYREMRIRNVLKHGDKNE